MKKVSAMCKIYLSEFHPVTNGSEDASVALRRCFSEASSYRAPVIVIEPGTYLMDSDMPVLLSSGMEVVADGAKFYFPQKLGENHDRVLFYGENISNFKWRGGKFTGYVYNPKAADNVWEPHTHTSCIEIYRTESGKADNLIFKHIEAENIAGPVVFVHGTKEGSRRHYAENIDVRNCNFINCGKFMWDYGYLWQKIVFSYLYHPREVENALQYMPKEYMSSALKMKNGRLYADYMPQKRDGEWDTVSFFGASMPEGLERGKQYYVVNEGCENGIEISETKNGEPISVGTDGKDMYLFRNMFYIYHDLFAPVGNHSPAKGAVDVTLCKNVIITNCRISASGDSMHILESENVVFSNNQILGARMGAFYIGFFCKNITVTGNTVFGANGSRIVSVERSSENITIVGNTFSGGGRGTWINQPNNLILCENIFIENTNKCTPDPKRGRVCYATGGFERYPEIYFTTWQDGAAYGPVIVKSNIIQTNEYALSAVTFNPGGRDILFESNVISGSVKNIHIAKGCDLQMRNNIGIENVTDEMFVNVANVPF